MTRDGTRDGTADGREGPDRDGAPRGAPCGTLPVALDGRAGADGRAAPVGRPRAAFLAQILVGLERERAGVRGDGAPRSERTRLAARAYGRSAVLAGS